MSGLFVVTEDDINSKSQFLVALRKFIHSGVTTVPYQHGEYRTRPGELTLLDAIANYFEAHTEIPDKNPGIGFWPDVHKHIADAFHEFRTHPMHEILRQIYQGQTEEQIPDLFDVRSKNRWSVLYDLGRVLPLIAGRMDPRIDERIDGYFNCQQHLVEATWRVFVRQCYRQIAPVIRDHGSYYEGLFGRTMLTVNAMAGRTRYTFERPMSVPEHLQLFEQITSIVDTPGADPNSKYAAIEAVLMTRQRAKSTYGAYEMSFAADESDMLGVRSGMNFPGSAITDYKVCVEMIEDVVAHWDLSKLVEVE